MFTFVPNVAQLLPSYFCELWVKYSSKEIQTLRFKNEHPNWKTYNSSLVTGELPVEIRHSLYGLLAAYGQSEDCNLKFVVNTINAAIRIGPTRNWGDDYLSQDLETSVAELFKAKFDLAMDALFNLAIDATDDFKAELNELFGEYNFAYRVSTVPDGQNYRWGWQLVDDSATLISEAVINTAVSTEVLCKQTSDHLVELVDKLSRGNERAHKDAVRDAMSATEALLRKVTGKKDIDDATAELQRTGTWGPKSVTRDGKTIWHCLHEIHGDIRHGNPNSTPLPLDEALYWIERMLAFVNYITRVQRLQSAFTEV